MVAASALALTVSTGYSVEPGWHYQGINTLGNVDVEETVHALFPSLFHLYDWLHQDSTISLSEPTVRALIAQNPDSIVLRRDYAKARKHMKRGRPGTRIAQITCIESGSQGGKMTVGYHSGINLPFL